MINTKGFNGWLITLFSVLSLTANGQSKKAAANTIFRTDRSKNTIANVKDFGAVGNGIANDTKALQKAINSSANIFFPSGSYKIKGKLTISKPTNITGSDATIQQLQAETNILFISADNCSISGLNFIGTATGSEKSFPKTCDSYGSAIVLQSVSHCMVANNTFTDFGNPVVECGSAIYLTGASHCTIKDNLIKNGCMAIGVDAYFDTSIANKIINNTIIGSRQGIVVDLQGPYSDACIADEVSGNKIYRVAKGIQFGDCQRGGIISNNLLKSISGIAISAIYRSRKLLIKDNIIDSAADCGIVVNDLAATQDDISIKDNIITYCGGDGIQAYTVYGLNISGNSIRFSRTGIAVPTVLCYSQKVIISNNHLLNNRQSGIWCYNAKDYLISNNLFKDNSSEEKNKFASLELRKGNYDMANAMVTNNFFSDDFTKCAISCTGAYYRNIMVIGNLFLGENSKVCDEIGSLMLRSNNVPNKN